VKKGRDDRANTLLGALFIVLASLLFALVIVMARVLRLSSFPVPTMLAIRFGVGTLVLAGLVLALRQPLRPAPREGRWLVAIGFVGYASAVYVLFSALRYGTAAAVSFLSFTYPVFVALLSIAFTRSFPGLLVNASLVLAAGGVALVATSGGSLSIEPLGILLALVSAVAAAGYLVAAAYKVQRTPSLTAALWMSASAGLALILGAGVNRDFVAPSSGTQWLLLFAIAICGTGALVLLLSGLPRIGPVRTSVIGAMEPLSVSVLSLFLLGEDMHPATGFGGALIVLGAIAATAAKVKVEQPLIPPSGLHHGVRQQEAESGSPPTARPRPSP
jgi:drug/metabolite transporter (DMT)-like permease